MSSCAPLAISLAPVADSGPVGCAVGVGPPPPEGLAVQGLVTEALARAERAEAEGEGYRREAVAQRSKAHAFAGQFRQCREKLAASRAAHDALGRSAKETLALQREVARLSALVAAMGGDGRKRSTNASLRLENGRLRQQVKAQSKALAAMRHACDTRDKEWARVRAQQARLQAFHSIARWMSGQGLAVSAGTLCDSIRRFIPLFSPLSEAIRAHHNQAAIQQGDETSWRIQELGVGGGSQRAWLWLALSADAAWFHIDPSRSTDAAKTLFAGAAPGTILVCDRYSSYKALARQLDLVLAFCWSHARRDFIDCEGAHVTPWKHAWLERIAALFKANATRLEHYDPNLDTDRQSPALRTAQHRLEATFEHLFNTAEHDLNDREASDPRAKPLRALLSHRQGLGVFVNHPKVPMDNNASERTFRAAANARKLCFGSDSQAGARFTAMMYSVFITCHLNAIDVTQWLRVWLEACAGNGGHPPRDLGPWLPWSMDPARKRTLSVAPARPP